MPRLKRILLVEVADAVKTLGGFWTVINQPSPGSAE